MKLTFLGHASWMIQHNGATVVSDLLVEDFFRNGTFTICPTRELSLASMPKLDALIITHRHRDHFDLDTLCQLDRSTKILCPDDPAIVYALRRLGYTDIEHFTDWSHHKVKDIELIFTPSENRVPENGFLATDGDVVFWNQVDTVISAQTIESIAENVGTVHLVAHGYQPMLETAALEAQSMAFPAAGYSQILHRAKLLAPRAVVPGSNGYRTAGTQSWFNAYKFPVSRERFVRDIERMLPGTATFIPNPGDVIELDELGMRPLPQSAENDFVRTVVDDARELMAFDPSRAKPELCDDNPYCRAEPDLRRVVRTIFEKRIPEGCKAKVGRFHALRVLGALIEIRVIYPDGRVEPWMLDLSGDTTTVKLGARDDESDVVMSIGASSLYDLAVGRTRPDVIALSGQFRVFSRAYRIEGTRLMAMGDLAPPAVHHQRSGMPWLLFDLIGYEKDFEVRQIDAEIDRLLGAEPASFERPLWERLAPSIAAPPASAVRSVFVDADGNEVAA